MNTLIHSPQIHEISTITHTHGAAVVRQVNTHRSPVMCVKAPLNGSFLCFNCTFSREPLQPQEAFKPTSLIPFHPVKADTTPQPQPESFLISLVTIFRFVWLKSGPWPCTQEGQVWCTRLHLRCLQASGYNTLSQKQLSCPTDNEHTHYLWQPRRNKAQRRASISSSLLQHTGRNDS